jgi:hypothetical protein
MRDLLGRVDIKRRAVFDSQGGKIDFVAVERAVTVSERTGALVFCFGLFGQNLNALCGECIWFFRNDDPGNDVSEGADSSKNDEECGEYANQIQIPAIVKGERSANSSDHAVATRTEELGGGCEGIGERSRYRIDGSSAGRTETGGRFQLFTAT